MPQSEESRTPALRDYARLVWSRIWLVVGVVVVCAGTAFLASYQQTSLYEASARLMYQPPADVTNPTGASQSVDSAALSIQLQSVIDIVDNPTVRARAKATLGTSDADASAKVTANLFVPKASSGGSTSSNLVEIRAVSTSPAAAAATANAYAGAIIALRKEWDRERYQVAQQVVRDQLDRFTTPSSKLSADYVNLVQQLSSLQIAEATATGGFRVIVPATPPDAPVSPKPLKSAAFGLGVGLLAGIGLAFVLGRLDTRVRTHRQASDILDLSVLGRLPRIPQATLRRGALVALAEPDGHFSEALRMLRTNLAWANIDDPVRSLLITSSIKGEGKTVTVCNLAVALARAGKKVIVVDADLRDPQVHRVMGLPNRVGLTSVVLGEVGADEALQVFRPLPSAPPVTLRPPASMLAATSFEKGRPRPASKPSASRAASPSRSDKAPTSTEEVGWVAEGLMVLTSGPLPPDPGEVIASMRLAAALKSLTDSEADYILVDSPPILSVGDAGALAASVDGLVFVVNLIKARRPVLVDGREQLDALPCRKAGSSRSVSGVTTRNATHTARRSHRAARSRPSRLLRKGRTASRTRVAPAARPDPVSDHGDDSLCGVTVPSLGAGAGRHRRGKDNVHGAQDRFGIAGVDQPIGPFADRHRPLSSRAQGETGHTKHRSFFLDAARVGEHQAGAVHELKEVKVAERLGEL